MGLLKKDSTVHHRPELYLSYFQYCHFGWEREDGIKLKMAPRATGLGGGSGW